MQAAISQAGAAFGGTVLRRSLRLTGRVVGIVAAVATLVCGWWWLAPPQLGGSTSFVVTDGTSMLPHLRQSDIVALRPSSTYRVGDVVGYRSELLRRVVLHRIVAIENGRYVLEGDNNSFRDPEQPRRPQIVGKMWFHFGHAGRVIDALHTPWIAAALAALLVLAAGLGRTDPR